MRSLTREEQELLIRKGTYELLLDCLHGGSELLRLLGDGGLLLRRRRLLGGGELLLLGGDELSLVSREAPASTSGISRGRLCRRLTYDQHAQGDSRATITYVTAPQFVWLATPPARANRHLALLLHLHIYVSLLLHRVHLRSEV